jgi:uncharacterized protein YeaC (DUF1315 family)
MSNEFDDIEFTPGTAIAEDPEQEEETGQSEQEKPKQEPVDETLDEGEDEDGEEDPEEEREPETPTHYEDTDDEKEKARANGWTPFDEWVKQGNPPQEWKTARHFNEVGELYQNQRRQNKDHQRELDNTRLLMEARIRDAQSKADQIESNLKDAVERGSWEEVQKLTEQKNQNQADQWLMQNQLQQATTTTRNPAKGNRVGEIAAVV